MSVATGDPQAKSARGGEQPCALCGRVCALTWHHLIPRKMHRRSRFKKRYSREELQAGIWICRLCHDGIHAHYDEMYLAQHRNTLEALTADPAIQKHIAWVAKQKIR